MNKKLISEQFRQQVEDYLESTGMSPTTFGALSCGNPNFMFKFRDGMSPRLDTAERVLKWIEDNPPEAS